MKNKNIVVTGGLGFIGSHVVEELVEKNQITIIDNKSSGKLENLNQADHENLKLIIEDLNKMSSLKLNSILKDVDYVFHLAALASVPMSVENPVMCNENNVDGTLKLLASAKDCEVSKLVFSSSSAIYGENPNMPLKEDEPMMPTSPYAASKASCELYCQSFWESYGLASVSLRYFNVFGPRQDVNSQYAAVIPKFIHQLVNNKEALIYGDGEQTRDFVYVKDVVKANIKACESEFIGPVNIASGEAISVNQLYEIIKNVLGTDLNPIYKDERQGEIKHSLANVENMTHIGFKTDSSLFRKQLETTIEWFKSQEK